MTDAERQLVTDLLAQISILEIGLSNNRYEPERVRFFCLGLRARIKTEAKTFGVVDSDLQLAIKELM